MVDETWTTTPPTDEVRRAYVHCRTQDDSDEPSEATAGGEFDRWLAKHDRDVAAAALDEAADAWQRGEWANAPRRADRAQERIANGQHVGNWLRERAARLLEEMP